MYINAKRNAENFVIFTFKNSVICNLNITIISIYIKIKFISIYIKEFSS